MSRGCHSAMTRPQQICLWLTFLMTEQVFCWRVQLEMYKDSLDDQYIGCLDTMESVASELLKKEREQRPELDTAWNISSATWEQRKFSIGNLPDGFRDEYGIALLIYTYMDLPLYKDLNRAVREYGQHPESFPFHSWHFYLTRALSLLRTSCDGKPWWTFRGTSKVQFEPPSDPRETIRLSQFSSSSADIKQAQQFGNASFFNITTCFGADLEKFSYYPSQKEVLIPVDEVFHVTKYIKEGNQLVLQTTNKRCSYYNCAYLGAPTVAKFSEAVSAPLLVAMNIAMVSATKFLMR